MMNDLTPKELAYILALQGILSSSEAMRLYKYDAVNAAVEIVDILFERIEQKRGASDA
jgi:hypothetical protein